MNRQCRDYNWVEDAVLAAVALLAAATIILCAGCGDSTFTPTAPTITGPTPEPVVQPRVDSPPALNQVVGVTAFGLALRDEDFIEAFCAKIQEAGYNTLRVGAETADWPGGYLPTGPDIWSGEAEANLHRVLDTTARVPGIWVQLMPVFTIKTRRPFREQLRWTEKVLKIAKPYRHVFIESVNEYHAHADYSRGQVIQLLSLSKSYGFLTGTDEGMRRGNYTHRFARHVNYTSFHTFRNPDPKKVDIERILRLNRAPVLFSETTCYTEIPGWRPGLCTNSKDQIVRLMNIMRSTPGTRWFFHSRKLITTDTLDFWIPRY